MAINLESNAGRDLLAEALARNATWGPALDYLVLRAGKAGMAQELLTEALRQGAAAGAADFAHRDPKDNAALLRRLVALARALQLLYGGSEAKLGGDLPRVLGEYLTTQAPEWFRTTLAAAEDNRRRETGPLPAPPVPVNLRAQLGDTAMDFCRHAGALLTLFPRPEAVNGLKALFRSLALMMGASERGLLGPPKVAPEVEVAGAHVLSALGACAAASSAPLDDRKARVREEKILAARHSLIATHNHKIDEFTATQDDRRREVLAREVQELRLKIRKEEEHLENLELPLFILLGALSSSQHWYTPTVRQGALLGLSHLAAKPDAPREAVEQLRAAIDLTLQPGDRKPPVRPPPAAPPAAPGEGIDLATVTAEDLLPELGPHRPRVESPERPELLKDPSAYRGDWQVRSWTVRLVAGSTATELLFALHEGLAWMQRSLGPRLTPPAPPELLRTVQLLLAKLPQTMDFLYRHPLRLISARDQARLGFCEADGYLLEFWTRYVPPPQKGEVLARYYVLEELAGVNQMGVAAEAWAEPLLLPAVLYHEYLHYRKISNEAEAHLRDHLFLRSLIAETAPAEDAALPAFEARLLAGFSVLGLEHELFWLLEDWQDPAAAAMLNAYIQSAYGPPLDRATALAQAEAQIRREDEQITLQNNDPEVIAWGAEVKWPLMEPARQGEYAWKVRERIREILVERRQRVNVIGTAAEVLARPEDQAELTRQQQAWQTYCARPGAGRCFREARSALLFGLALRTLAGLLERAPEEAAKFLQSARFLELPERDRARLVGFVMVRALQQTAGADLAGLAGKLNLNEGAVRQSICQLLGRQGDEAKP